MLYRCCHILEPLGTPPDDARLSDKIIAAHMSSFIPNPIAWVIKNATQERRPDSLAPRQPNVITQYLGDSLIQHTPRVTRSQRRLKAKSFSCVTRLAPDRSQSLICCPTVNHTVPYVPDSLVHSHPTKYILATQSCVPIPISIITMERQIWSCDQERIPGRGLSTA